MEFPPKGQAQGTVAQAAPERLGKYPLLSVIGTGSMGVVYKSFDAHNNRPIALKTIRRELLDDEIENFPARFRIEAQAAEGLTHPGIVGVYEYGEAEGYAYIAMEYVDGHSLRDCLERQVRFNIDQTIGILTQLLEALQYAHEHGVWHRDVKPANILLLSDGRIKVTDFGIACVECANMAHADTIMGTPGFIAPELYLSDEFDHRIDLFAAGVVFYHLLAGVPPFAGSVDKIMLKVCYETPLPASVVARQPSLRRFDAVVLKALATRPEDRFSSANEFLDALLLAQAGGPAGADATVIVSRGHAQAGVPIGADETRIVSRGQAQADVPVSADETRILARELAGAASADKTLVISRPSVDSAGADKTLIISRPPGDSAGADKTLVISRPSADSAGPDKTLIISRRPVPDEADHTIIHPSSKDFPLTEPLPPQALEPDADKQPISAPQSVSQPRSASESQSVRQPQSASESQSVKQSQSVSAPQSANGPSRTPGWNTQDLAQVEKQLAHFVGPIAKVLVRNAARETSDLVSLIQWVAPKISNSSDREAFLRGTGVAWASQTKLRSASGAQVLGAPAGGGAPLTPEYVTHAAQHLTLYLGPIAKVLAKRAAEPGSSREQFVATLAAHLRDDRERARFLKAIA